MKNNNNFNEEMKQLSEFINAISQMLAGMKEMHRCASEYEVLKDGQKLENLFAQIDQFKGVIDEKTIRRLEQVKILLFGDGTYKETLLNSVRAGGIMKEQWQVLINLNSTLN